MICYSPAFNVDIYVRVFDAIRESKHQIDTQKFHRFELSSLDKI